MEEKNIISKEENLSLNNEFGFVQAILKYDRNFETENKTSASFGTEEQIDSVKEDRTKFHKNA